MVEFVNVLNYHYTLLHLYASLYASPFTCYIDHIELTDLDNIASSFTVLHWILIMSRLRPNFTTKEMHDFLFPIINLRLYIYI